MTTHRKLATILAADNSRLMGEDDKATVPTLTECRQVFADQSCRHQGRLDLLLSTDSVI